MIGLGETFEEIEQTLADLAAHNVKMVTIGHTFNHHWIIYLSTLIMIQNI